MSHGYADRLAPRENLGGQLGAPENFDDEKSLQTKLEQLTLMVESAKKIVFFTGAGISVACGIPDFRGPNGVWTLQKQGKKIPKNTTPFYAAKPTFTHMAIVGLFSEGKVTYVISQNVDCLHLRSGIPPCNLAELHGNCFAERCPKCKFEYIRGFEQETVGKKATGRSCTQPNCTGRLRDNILDWEDDLPEEEYNASIAYAKKADLIIVLGSSLQVTPANDIPVQTVRNGGKLVIVNLQETPKDKHANLIIRAKSDQVMKHLVNSLNIAVPSYKRQERISIQTQQMRPKLNKDQEEQLDLIISIYGQDGPRFPIPMVKQISVKFPKCTCPARTETRGPKGCSSLTHQIRTKPGSLMVSVEVKFVEYADSDKREGLAEFEVYLYNMEEYDIEAKDAKQKFLTTQMELGFTVQCAAYMSEEEIAAVLQKRNLLEKRTLSSSFETETETQQEDYKKQKKEEIKVS